MQAHVGEPLIHLLRMRTLRPREPAEVLLPVRRRSSRADGSKRENELKLFLQSGRLPDQGQRP